jgi:hypothetical protein
MAVRSDVLRAGAGGVPLTRQRESLWQDAFRRLLKNRAAVVGAYRHPPGAHGDLCASDCAANV